MIPLLAGKALQGAVEGAGVLSFFDKPDAPGMLVAYARHTVRIGYAMGIHRVWIGHTYQSMQPIARKRTPRFKASSMFHVKHELLIVVLLIVLYPLILAVSPIAGKRALPAVVRLFVGAVDRLHLPYLLPGGLLKRLYQKTVFELYNRCFIPQLIH